jgi:hypothetical protein
MAASYELIYEAAGLQPDAAAPDRNSIFRAIIESKSPISCISLTNL